jgi:hypothetical protein
MLAAGNSVAHLWLMLLIMLVYGGSDASTPEPLQHIQASEHNEGAPDILNSTASKFPYKIKSEVQIINKYSNKNSHDKKVYKK